MCARARAGGCREQQEEEGRRTQREKQEEGRRKGVGGRRIATPLNVCMNLIPIIAHIFL